MPIIALSSKARLTLVLTLARTLSVLVASSLGSRIERLGVGVAIVSEDVDLGKIAVMEDVVLGPVL